MRNRDVTFEDVDGHVESQLDGLLILPPIAYLVLLFMPGQPGVGAVFVLWAIGVLFWTPWIIFRCAMLGPRADVWRAAAILGCGLLPWILFVPLIGALTSHKGALIGFPPFVVWGGGALAMAASGWPRLRTPGARRAMLVAGAASYGLLAIMFLGAIALRITDVGLWALAICIVFGGINLLAAAALGRAVLRAPARSSLSAPLDGP